MNNHSPAYNLKAVMRETGLTSATIHAWERRYELFTPQRSPGGHRLFNRAEINLLKWLAARKDEGLSIGQAVALWRSQAVPVQEQVQDNPIPLPVRVPSTGTLDQLRKNWVDACLAFDEPEAELATAKALAIATPEVVCIQILQKGLADLGEGWYNGKVSVQQEHFASALTARRLNALFAVAPLPAHPERLLAACPPGETHDLSLLMLAFLLRWQGWEVIYLGADVPLDKLDVTLQATKPRLVLSTAQTLPAAASLAELARLVNSRSIPLAYGGGIFNQIAGLTERIPGHFLGQNVDTAPPVVERLFKYRLSPPVPSPLPPDYIISLARFREKEALVVARVKEILRSSPIDPHHIEEANAHFPQTIIAALELGNINFLDHSAEWLNQLLENSGLPPSSARRYYQAFHQALQEQPGLQARPVLEWLSSYE